MSNSLRSTILMCCLVAACGEVDPIALPCRSDAQCQLTQAGSVCAPLEQGGLPYCHLPDGSDTVDTGTSVDTDNDTGDVCPKPCQTHDLFPPAEGCDAGYSCGWLVVGDPLVCYVPCDLALPGGGCSQGTCYPLPSPAPEEGIGSGYCAPICGG